MAFVTPVVDHWLEREIAQWVHREGSILQLWNGTITLPVLPFLDSIFKRNKFYYYHMNGTAGFCLNLCP